MPSLSGWQLIMMNDLKMCKFKQLVKHYFFGLITVPLFSIGVVSVSMAQGISAADLSALKGAAALQTAAGGVGGLGAGAGLPGLLAITVPMDNAQDDAEIAQDNKKAKKPAPLLPNEFQKYVLQTTGQALPLYGAEFFENLNNNNGQFSRSPVSDDYSLGAGDQLGTDVAGCTGLVVDGDLLAQPFGQLLGDQAAAGVGDTAGRERHHQPDRPIGPSSCLRRSASKLQQSRQRQSAGSE